MVSTGWRYAQTVNEQVNPNRPKNNHWKYINGAVGFSTNYAVSSYTKTKKNTKNKDGKTITTYEENYPYVITAHDFRLNIPDSAKITSIEIEARFKVSNNKANVQFPKGLLCFYGVGWSKHYNNTKGVDTGWWNGLYFINPTKTMTTSWYNYKYNLTGADVVKANLKGSDLNSTVAGIDLMFDDSDFSESAIVYLQFVRIKVDYDLPNYTLVHSGVPTSESRPVEAVTGHKYTKYFYLSQTKEGLKGGRQCLRLKTPFGVTINSISASAGNIYKIDNNNYNWVVNCNGKVTHRLDIQFTDYTVNTDCISLSPIECTGSSEPHPSECNLWFRSGFNKVDDYGDITTQILDAPHYRSDCCFAVASKIISTNDSTITFNLNPDFEYENIQYELDTALSSEGISIESYTDDSITFNVPEDSELDLCFRFCMRLLQQGDASIQPTIVGGSTSNKVEFTIKEPYEYHFGNKQGLDEDENISYHRLDGELIGFLNHRVASTLETSAYVLPCTVKDNDAVMIQSKPNVHMYKWGQLDYIGCVPLEHLHFDPKSTYKDKLLDTHYKNNRFMGKELASDETITLNVRLHPHQVTTIQGLIDMDKPIPINANHRIFEGDALNHRGWAEIYGITSKRTNPSWYKCEIDVKYLTHNLNTRFKINKGDKTFSKYSMPTLLLESVSSGDALSDGDESIDYFLIDTDGGYIYNSEEQSTEYYFDDDGKYVFFVVGESEELVREIIEEYGEENVNITHGETPDEFNSFIQDIVDEGYTVIDAEIGEAIKIDNTAYTNENQRNIFTLDEGEHFTIKSRNPLSNVSQVTYDWTTSKLPELKENQVSKIIRLIDSLTNTTMFEYEYSDFDFGDYYNQSEENVEDAQISCHVIGRAYKHGDYEEVINEDIWIPVLVLDDEDILNSDDTEIDDVYYGSSLSFRLNNNVLAVTDTGYNGKALEKNGIELEGESYIYEVEWKNNNSDGEDNDITTYVDISTQDSLLASQYNSKYSNMIVSPFPVADKNIIFTRNAEEGVIYYLEDDKEEFSYLIEPFYQYHNGVDLRTGDGLISIFNLNYGYKTVYLENGLVSLGINRLNGQMYLRKWNDTLKEYITLFYLQLENYDDVNINSISDDRIELQASNTRISMYRGHPYVILNHQLEDIDIRTGFGKVWAEQVDDNIQAYPTYYDLLNTQNLLSQCVGGIDTLDDECVTVFECGDDIECPDLDEVSITVSAPEEIFEGEEFELGVTGDLEEGDLIYFVIDGDVVSDPVSYPDTYSHKFEESREYEVSAVFVGDDTRSYAVAPIKVIYAKQRETDPQTPTPPDAKYRLSIVSPSTFRYGDGKLIKFKLTKGGVPVEGKTIEKVNFNSIHSSVTDVNGLSTMYNNVITTHPRKYKIGARFYEGGKLITSVFKDVIVAKANTEFIVNSFAGHSGGIVSFKLRNKDTHANVKGVKVTVYINGKAYTKKTNSSGNVAWKIPKKGNITYKCAFVGTKDYNKASRTFKERIRR